MENACGIVGGFERRLLSDMRDEAEQQTNDVSASLWLINKVSNEWISSRTLDIQYTHTTVCWRVYCLFSHKYRIHNFDFSSSNGCKIHARRICHFLMTRKMMIKTFAIQWRRIFACLAVLRFCMCAESARALTLNRRFYDLRCARITFGGKVRTQHSMFELLFSTFNVNVYRDDGKKQKFSAFRYRRSLNNGGYSKWHSRTEK